MFQLGDFNWTFDPNGSRLVTAMSIVRMSLEVCTQRVALHIYISGNEFGSNNYSRCRESGIGYKCECSVPSADCCGMRRPEAVSAL